MLMLAALSADASSLRLTRTYAVLVSLPNTLSAF